jgi:protein phosphatase
VRLSRSIALGVSTHTGRVRSANEDDYLICAPQDEAELRSRGWFLAIADGMGGATGGAEASRTAVRAAVRPHLEQAVADPDERMRACFAESVREVYEMSRENPTLRGMGTTLTILNYLGDQLVLGHVGDTRCLRIRDRECTQLTEDHAIKEPESFLTRCVGAGQREVEVDVARFEVRPGDRFLLASDGLWGVVPEAEIQRLVLALAPQDATVELVRQANRRGGPDNITVLIMHVRAPAPGSEPGAGAAAGAGIGFHDIELPAEEQQQPALLRQPDRGLIAPWWPWALLVVAVILLWVGVAKAVWKVDLWRDLVGWFVGGGS